MGLKGPTCGQQGEEMSTFNAQSLWGMVNPEGFRSKGVVVVVVMVVVVRACMAHPGKPGNMETLVLGRWDMEGGHLMCGG